MQLREKVYGSQQRITALRQATATETMQIHSVECVLLPGPSQAAETDGPGAQPRAHRIADFVLTQ